MIKNQVTEGMANVMLRQLGAAEIKTVSAFVNKVKFRLDENTNVTYIYELKENEAIYLTRVRPYSLYLGPCANEQELIDRIERDYFMFRAAHESPHFQMYLQILEKVQALSREMESLFMQKTTPDAELEEIGGKLQALYGQIRRLKKNDDDLRLVEEMKRQEKEVLGFELPRHGTYGEMTDEEVQPAGNDGKRKQ